MPTTETPTTATKPFWLRCIAGLLDLVTAFFVIGYVIALITGETYKNGYGFFLNGGSAWALILLMFMYFYLGWKVVGGTIWQRILGCAGRPRGSNAVGDVFK